MHIKVCVVGVVFTCTVFVDKTLCKYNLSVSFAQTQQTPFGQIGKICIDIEQAGADITGQLQVRPMLYINSCRLTHFHIYSVKYT